MIHPPSETRITAAQDAALRQYMTHLKECHNRSHTERQCEDGQRLMGIMFPDPDPTEPQDAAERIVAGWSWWGFGIGAVLVLALGVVVWWMLGGGS